MRSRSFVAIAMAAWIVAGAVTAAAAGCAGGPTDTANGAGGGAGGPVIILDGGGEVAMPPNGETLCPAGACNYQTNAGCTGAMPSCVPSLGPGEAVAPSCQVAGAGMSGAACAQWTDCAPGFICAEGACHKLCCGGDWTACPSAGEHCIRPLQLKGGSGQVLPSGAMLCYAVNTCDALAPVSCSQPGTTCQIVDPTGATACFPEGAGESGEACPCKGGFLCVAGQCRRLCKAVEGGGEPSCKAGEGACVHFNRDPAGVGECTQL